MENYNLYQQVYRPYSSPAFLPVSLLRPNLDGDPISGISTPAQCFSDPASRPLGFEILRDDLRPHAEKLGVQQHPNARLLIRVLQDNRPSMKNARVFFEYLASRNAGMRNLFTQFLDFSMNDWRIMSGLKFIPVKNTYCAPVTVYFDGSGEFAEFFNFVDFGSVANSFLRNCGVKDQPNPKEIAGMIVRDPQSFLDVMGFESYLGTLRLLAAHYSTLRADSSLRNAMKSSRFLVGIVNKAIEEDPDKDRDKLTEYRLGTSKDIFLIDDAILSRIFTPLGCPLDSILEDMYSDLGSTWISSQVRERYTPQGNSQATEKAKRLEALIKERAELLLYEGVVVRSNKEFAAGSMDILKQLSVWEVPFIEIHREFQRRTNIQHVGACISMEKSSSKGRILFISGDFDFFDVAAYVLALFNFQVPCAN